MRTANEIVELLDGRKKRQSKWANLARTVRDIYNSEMVLPLPEMDQMEMPAVANLAYQGIEQMSMRIASTMPTVEYPPLRPGIKLSENRARERGLVNLAWWDKNRLQLKMQKRARHLIAYACSPVLMRPDYSKKKGEYGYPCWQVRDPLSTFAADMQPGDVYPDDCIFAYQRKMGWLKRRYPMGFQQINKRRNYSDEDPFELLEYTAEDEYVLVAVGESHDSFDIAPNAEGKIVELERIPNRLGRCWAVVPSRITLDRWKGQFDGVIGIYFTQAMLMALEVIGMKRAIFPEEWVNPLNAEDTGTVITQADPMRGIVGVIKGGKIDVHRVDPSVLGTQMVDRLERNIRVETSIPAELGGESTSNIRTGRRGDAVMAAAVDFPVQMAQQIFEQSLQCENEIAIAIDKEYFNRSKTFWISATKGKVEYTPSELWETDVNFVKYSHAGTDINSLVVAGLQRVGSGTMSKQTFMRMDPMIDDPESVHDEITYEALEMAMLTSLQTRASEDPTFAPIVAEIAQKIIEDKISVFEAYTIVDQALKEQQAGQAPVPPEAGQPGAADPLAAVGPPGPSAQNLTQLLTSLKAGSRAVA